MVSIATGSNPDIQKDAHYHAINATVKWAEFVRAMQQSITNTQDERARKLADEKRATTYARGTLGGH